DCRPKQGSGENGEQAQGWPSHHELPRSEVGVTLRCSGSDLNRSRLPGTLEPLAGSAKTRLTAVVAAAPRATPARRGFRIVILPDDPPDLFLKNDAPGRVAQGQLQHAGGLGSESSGSRVQWTGVPRAADAWPAEVATVSRTRNLRDDQARSE